MNELIKIKDMTGKYDVSARTLRYYEDMGLISSVRSDDYAYRLYDESAAKRLEQILILRRLNIGIKDIKRVFSVPGSDVVLEVLETKVADIDDEVALLHELKEIILEFIQQIKSVDFANEADVKLLYEKAKDIETQLFNVDYNGNPSAVNRLLEVTEKLAVTPDIVEKRSYCYLIFNLGSVSNVLEACEMYGKAFGAERTSMEVDPIPGPDWIGMDIKLFNFTIFMQFTSNPLGGNCCIKFTSQNELKEAYDVVKEGAIECSLNTDWHWTPLSAIVKDKFGVNWLLCV